MLYLPEKAWWLSNGKSLFFFFRDEEGNRMSLQIRPDDTDFPTHLCLYGSETQRAQMESIIRKHGNAVNPQDFRIEWDKATELVAVIAKEVADGSCTVPTVV